MRARSLPYGDENKDQDELAKPADDELAKGARRFDEDDDRASGPGHDDADADEHDDADEVEDSQRRGRRRDRRRGRGGAPERHGVSTQRRAELVAAAAAIAAGERAPVSKAAARRRRSREFNRLAVLVVLAALAVAVAAMIKTSDPVTALSPSDASFMSTELVAADQRVRRSLLRLPRSGPALALDHTRDAIATTRALAIELRNSRDAVAQRLRTALTLEGAWLDAIGSTLANPRSPLLAQLASRDRAARPALAALPGRAGAHVDGARQLLEYSRSRVAGSS